MATLTALRATDLLYVPEVTEYESFNLEIESHPAFTLSPKSGGPFRIEMAYELGQAAIASYTYSDNNGFWYGAFGFRVTLDEINALTDANDAFGLRSLQFKGADSMTGSPFSDRLLGFDGNDFLSGAAGDDDLNGNRGDDTVEGNAGRDFVRGGQGDDLVTGLENDDWHVNGNIGSDTVFGGDGDDIVYGGQGYDWVVGEAGDDLVFGDSGPDLLFGGPGDDTLTGGPDVDWFLVYQNEGRDVITDFQPFELIYIPSNINGLFIPNFAALEPRISGLDGGALIDLGSGNSLFLPGVPYYLLSEREFFFTT